MSQPARSRWRSRADRRGGRGRRRAAGRGRPRCRDPRRHCPCRGHLRAGHRRSARLIAEAFDKVGKDGVITVEEAQTMGLELEFTEGMQFDKGYISPYMVTDPERMEAVLDDALRADPPGQDLGGRRPAAAAGEDRPERQAAADRGRGRRGRGALDAGRQQDPRAVRLGGRQGTGLRRPPQGDAAGHGRAQPVPRSSAPEVGLKLDQVGLEVLGSARRVVVTKDDTTVIDGGG